MKSLNELTSHGRTRLAAMAVLVGLMLLVGKPVLAQDARDLEIDLAMGVLDDDPVLNRILTTQPVPWPGPRYAPRSEGIIKRDAEQAQDDFRPLIPQNNLVCTLVPNNFGKLILVCK